MVAGAIFALLDNLHEMYKFLDQLRTVEPLFDDPDKDRTYGVSNVYQHLAQSSSRVTLVFIGQFMLAILYVTALADALKDTDKDGDPQPINYAFFFFAVFAVQGAT